MNSTQTQPSCVFCSICQGTIPASIAYQDEFVIVITDRAPKASIHYLIIPKKHIASIQDLTDTDTELAAHLLFTAQKISTIIPGASDFKLISNNGVGAGQIVFHLHVHFLAGEKFEEM